MFSILEIRDVGKDRTIFIKVKTDGSVGDIKRRITDKLGVSESSFYLIFADRFLPDEESIDNIASSNNSLVMRMCEQSKL